MGQLNKQLNKRTWVGSLCGIALLGLISCSPGSTGSGATAPATGSQGAAQEVRIDMGDFFYEPNEVTIPAGTVRFLLTNVGKTAHRFRVLGDDINVSSKNVGAGRESVFEVTLGPGTYKMGCTLGDHEQRGAVGKITVQ